MQPVDIDLYYCLMEWTEQRMKNQSREAFCFCFYFFLDKRLLLSSTSVRLSALGSLSHSLCILQIGLPQKSAAAALCKALSIVACGISARQSWRGSGRSLPATWRGARLRPLLPSIPPALAHGRPRRRGRSATPSSPARGSPAPRRSGARHGGAARSPAGRCSGELARAGGRGGELGTHPRQ